MLKTIMLDINLYLTQAQNYYYTHGCINHNFLSSSCELPSVSLKTLNSTKCPFSELNKDFKVNIKERAQYGVMLNATDQVL